MPIHRFLVVTVILKTAGEMRIPRTLMSASTQRGICRVMSRFPPTWKKPAHKNGVSAFFVDKDFALI